VDELHVLFGTMASLLLNWKKEKKGPDLPTGITHFLHTALVVARSGKSDSAYTSLRRLVKEGVLGKDISEEQRNLMKELSAHYEGLIGLLEGA
jgi:hypothetical protein